MVAQLLRAFRQRPSSLSHFRRLYSFDFTSVQFSVQHR